MRRAAGITVAAALTTVVFAAPAGAAQGGVTVKNDVTYRTVDGEQLGLDVYQPAKKGKNRPAVVVVHGGGWTQGDKALFAQQSNQLAERGFVAFSINYRLAPAHRTRPRSRTWKRRSNGCASTPRSTASTPSGSARWAGPRAGTSSACSPPTARARSRPAIGSRRWCRGRARWTSSASPRPPRPTPAARSARSSGACPTRAPKPTQPRRPSRTSTRPTRRCSS